MKGYEKRGRILSKTRKKVSIRKYILHRIVIAQKFRPERAAS